MAVEAHSVAVNGVPLLEGLAGGPVDREARWGVGEGHPDVSGGFRVLWREGRGGGGEELCQGCVVGRKEHEVLLSLALTRVQDNQL